MDYAVHMDPFELEDIHMQSFTNIPSIRTFIATFSSNDSILT